MTRNTDPIQSPPAHAGPKAPADDGYSPPLSVSLPDVLPDGTDEQFRKVIYGLFVSATRFQDIREAFGREIGVTGSQYFTLVAAAQHHAQGGIGMRALADYLHVAPSHVTVEVGKLAARGLLEKRANPADGRGVLVSLTATGKRTLDGLAPFRRQINNILFDGFSREDFLTLSRLLDIFVATTARAEHEIALHEHEKQFGEADGRKRRPDVAMKSPQAGRVDG